MKLCSIAFHFVTVAEAGIIVLPPHPEVHGTEAQVEVDMPDSETNVLKWPMKSGLSNSDLLDPNDSWYDTPPEGFSLNVSLSFESLLSLLFFVIVCLMHDFVKV